MAEKRESDCFGMFVDDAGWAATFVAIRVGISNMSDVEPLLKRFSWVLRAS